MWFEELNIVIKFCEKTYVFFSTSTYSSQMALTRVLWRMGIFHGDDDSLGEEVLVDSHQVLLGHQHDEGSKKKKMAYN